MTNYLTAVDSSKNMEDLRSSRSFNELVVVLTRIKTSALSITNRLGKLVSEASKKSKIDLNADDKSTDSLREVHTSLDSLIKFRYEVQFAQSQSDIIGSDTKLEKYRKLLNSVSTSVIIATNLAFKFFDTLGSRTEPSTLVEYSQEAEKILAKLLKFTKSTTISIPSAEDKTTYIKALILRNVSMPNDYVLPEFIVSLRALNNNDNTFSYGVAFPTEIFVDSTFTGFTSKKILRDLIEQELVSLMQLNSVTELRDGAKRMVESLPSVYMSYVQDGELVIELESGVTGSIINSVLTRVLSVAHVALGVEDITTDIVHKVVVGEKGNKEIRITLTDRNLYNTKAVGELKNMLSLSTASYRSLKQITGI